MNPPPDTNPTTIITNDDLLTASLTMETSDYRPLYQPSHFQQDVHDHGGTAAESASMFDGPVNLPRGASNNSRTHVKSEVGFVVVYKTDQVYSHCLETMNKSLVEANIDKQTLCVSNPSSDKYYHAHYAVGGNLFGKYDCHYLNASEKWMFDQLSS